MKGLPSGDPFYSQNNTEIANGWLQGSVWPKSSLVGSELPSNISPLMLHLILAGKPGPINSTTRFRGGTCADNGIEQHPLSCV